MCIVLNQYTWIVVSTVMSVLRTFVATGDNINQLIGCHFCDMEFKPFSQLLPADTFMLTDHSINGEIDILGYVCSCILVDMCAFGFSVIQGYVDTLRTYHFCPLCTFAFAGFFPSALNCWNIFRIPLSFWKHSLEFQLSLSLRRHKLCLCCACWIPGTDDLLIWLEC